MEKSDAELVIESLNGGSRAFEEIIRRYQRLVFNIAYHYLGRRNEVEDIAQEIFLKLYRSLDRFDTNRSLQAWVSRIAANACLDELRKIKSRRVSSFADFNQDEEDRINYLFEKTAAGAGLSQQESEESLALLQKAMEELSEKDRMAFVLREMEGMEYAGVAEALNASQTAVRIRVSRARKKLQRRVKAMLSNRGVERGTV